MTRPAQGTVVVETFHGTPDGAFGVTLIDGTIESLTLPARAMDPVTASELGETLVHLVNAAMEKHAADLLAAVEPPRSTIDPGAVAVERFVARAVADANAAIASSLSLRRTIAAVPPQVGVDEVRGHSPEGDVEAALVLGRLRRITINEHVLATARPTVVANAVMSAVHDALSHAVVDHHHLIDSLTPEQLTHETDDLHNRIAALEGDRQ